MSLPNLHEEGDVASAEDDAVARKLEEDLAEHAHSFDAASVCRICGLSFVELWKGAWTAGLEDEP